MPHEGTPPRPPLGGVPVPDGGVGAYVSHVSGGQIAVGNRVVQIYAEQGSTVVAGDTEPLEVVRRPGPIQRGLRPPRRLVGRQAELQQVHAMLDQGRSVEITGPHGVGKTTLLCALCAMPLPQAAPDGVVAPPAGLPVDDVLQFVFDACLERSQRIQPTPEEVLRYLRDLRLFVILDDPDLSRAEIERIIRALPGAVFAISSLEKLFVAGDFPVTLRGLDTEDAVQLLADALGRDLGADENEAAVRLTTGLSGVPLEILQLAAVVADRGLSLNTVAYDIAPSMDDPRAALQSATVDTLNAREQSVLVALAAFGGVAVGIGLLAKYASEPEAGAIVRRLVARGLARGDDLVGWAPVDPSVAEDEDRRRAAPVIIGWAGEPGRDPREVALESPAILAVSRRDVDEGRYDSVIRLAAATESMLALAGNWGAWQSLLQNGLAAARAVSDHASEAFFSHQLDVRADMLRPRTPAEENLAEAMEEPDHLYRTTTQPVEPDHTAEISAAVQGGGRPKWAVPLGIGLFVAVVIVIAWVLWPQPTGAAVDIAAGDIPADGEGRVSVTVSGADPDSRVEIMFDNADDFWPASDACSDESGFLSCALDADLGEQTLAAFVVPEAGAGEVVVTATVFTADEQAAQGTLTVDVTGEQPKSERRPQASFAWNPVSGLEVELNASGSSDPDGSLESYEWDLGDGNSEEGEQVRHTYDEPGEYSVTLTVTDDDGLADQDSQTVSVEFDEPEPQPPQASFTWNQVSGLEVELNASGSSDPDGSLESFEWDLGDGVSRSGLAVRHTYDEPGDYTVTLTVTDDDGLVDEDSQEVQVSAVRRTLDVTTPPQTPPPTTTARPTPTAKPTDAPPTQTAIR